MKTKMGRPILPKGEAKDFQIGVRFNRDEAIKVKAAISKAKMTNSDWARKGFAFSRRLIVIISWQIECARQELNLQPSDSESGALSN